MLGGDDYEARGMNELVNGNHFLIFHKVLMMKSVVEKACAVVMCNDQ